MKNTLDRKFCVAPMMGYTTPHARRLYRMLSAKTFLFTEMIATKTMLHSKNRDLIIENDIHNPIACKGRNAAHGLRPSCSGYWWR